MTSLGQAANLLTPRYLHTSTNIGGTVLLAGGMDQNGNILQTTEIVQRHLVSGQLTTVPGPPMSDGRAFFTATYMPLVDQVLLAGGCCSLTSADVFDPQSGSMTPTGAMAVGRAGHVATLLPNGQVLITGGSDNPTTLNSAEVYDPLGGGFTLIDPMLTPRLFHTATLLPTGQILVVGGGDDTGNPTATAELCTPTPPSVPVKTAVSRAPRAANAPKH